jgi:hypothetical protein
MNSLGENLIFLISQPRAGSTLLQRVLCGHPDIFATAEPWLMLHPIYALKETGHTAEYDQNLARTALLDFCGNIDGGTDAYMDAVRAYATTLYESALRPSGKRLFLDKTPRYYFICDELRRAFPKAKFIFLLRNPLAVLASVLETWVKQDWSILRWYQADLLQAPRLIATGIREFGDAGIVVRYEEFVSDPTSKVQQLCQRLEVPFHSEMLEYGGHPKPKGSMGDQVGIVQHSRPVTESLEKWTKVFSDPHRHSLACNYLTAIGPTLLEELGYPEAELRHQLNCGPAAELDREWTEWANNFFGISSPPLVSVEEPKVEDAGTQANEGAPQVSVSASLTLRESLASALTGTFAPVSSPSADPAAECVRQARNALYDGNKEAAKDWLERALDYDNPRLETAAEIGKLHFELLKLIPPMPFGLESRLQPVEPDTVRGAADSARRVPGKPQTAKRNRKTPQRNRSRKAPSIV